MDILRCNLFAEVPSDCVLFIENRDYLADLNNFQNANFLCQLLLVWAFIEIAGQPLFGQID